MQYWKHTIAALAYLASVAAPAWSQATTTITANDGMLTLPQAIAIAQQQNRGTLASRQRVLGAQAKIREARAGLLPQFTISGNAGQTNPFSQPAPAPAVPGGSGLTSFINSASGRANSASYQIQGVLSETLFAGFRIVDGIRVAELGEQAATEDDRGIRQDTALNVTLAYFAVLQAQGAVDIARQSLRSAEAHLADAQKSLKAGVATRLDVLRAETQVYDFRQQVSRAQLGVLTAQNSLNVLMYRPLGTPLNLDANADVAQPEVALEAARAAAVQQRSELRRQQLLKQIDLLTARIQGNATLPAVTVSVNALHGDADNPNGNRSTYGYGINVNWNVFDGFAAASRAAQFEANARADQLLLEQLRSTVSAEVEQNLQNITEARERVAVTKKGVEAAQESLRLAARRYQAGVGTNTEVLDAQSALTAAQNNYNNAHFDLETAQARFNRSLGNTQ